MAENCEISSSATSAIYKIYIRLSDVTCHIFVTTTYSIIMSYFYHASCTIVTFDTGQPPPHNEDLWLIQRANFAFKKLLTKHDINLLAES